MKEMNCRVYEVDVGEISAKRYAKPESFSTKKARQDLWMGNMMWQMENKGHKINGEKARKIMYKYMSSDFYKKIKKKWRKAKTASATSEIQTPTKGHVPDWLVATPKDKPVRKPIRKPIRRPVKK